MPLLLTLTRHWCDSGVNMFQVTSQCQQHTLSLRRGVHAPPKHHLPLRDRFFPLFIPCETSQGLLNAASLKQQPQQDPPNPLCCFRNVYLLYEAATLVRKLLSSPHCFPVECSVLSDLHMSCCPWAFTPQRHKGWLIEKYQFIKGFIFPTRNIQYQTSHCCKADNYHRDSFGKLLQ